MGGRLEKRKEARITSVLKVFTVEIKRKKKSRPARKHKVVGN